MIIIFDYCRQGTLKGLTAIDIATIETVTLHASGNSFGYPTGTYHFDYINLDGEALLNINGALPPNNLTILAGWLTTDGFSGINSTLSILFNVAGDVTINWGTIINATAGGYAARTGLSPGTTANSGWGGGGAHGGVGGYCFYSDGVTGTGGLATYGDVFQPFAMGSGGYSAPGGRYYFGAICHRVCTN